MIMKGDDTYAPSSSLVDGMLPFSKEVKKVSGCFVSVADVVQNLCPPILSLIIL